MSHQLGMMGYNDITVRQQTRACKINTFADKKRQSILQSPSCTASQLEPIFKANRLAHLNQPNPSSDLLLPVTPETRNKEMCDIDTIKAPNGAEITVCQPHRLELCHICCMDFVDMNKEDILEMDKVQAASKNPAKPLDGRIAGLMKETDEDSEFYGDTCYVIRLRDKTFTTYPVDWLHDEWLVKVDEKYIAASKVIQLIST
ncbi:hypothetical protein PCANC_03268 [Puccinia coronata f. sp. avenae]|uniref:Uncharacterized protein n=1 Tax=Puccinia coronata f. sp. avenae TaxID=200324 RepID=A0A2N5VZ20_9BASI|nr:hypothetical protein PCANC_03268 [Puccinia coronata f. sp. avenae]